MDKLGQTEVHDDQQNYLTNVRVLSSKMNVMNQELEKMGIA